MSALDRLFAWVRRASRSLRPGAAGADGPPRTGEQRAAIRVPVDLHVRLRFEDRDDAVRSQSLDLSVGGIFIVTAKPRPEGTVVRLTLEIGDELVDARGVVVRSVMPAAPGKPTTRRNGMGIVFTELEPESHDIIASLVAERGRQ